MGTISIKMVFAFSTVLKLETAGYAALVHSSAFNHQFSIKDIHLVPSILTYQN